jgi:menaquinone-dependent protoporphyrinogen oxidase
LEAAHHFLPTGGIEMNRVLIAYVSRSGSTVEIARFIGNELSTRELAVDAKPISETSDLSSYDFVIAGGLIYRFGWHPEIIRFLKENLEVLKARKTALFVTGLRLVRTPDCDGVPYPIFIDPAILKSPTDLTIGGLKKGPLDTYTTMKRYLKTALPTIEEISPVSLAFFAGKLDLQTLQLPERLIMLILMLLIGKKPGDYRNWESIRAWVDGLSVFGSRVEPRMKASLVEPAVMRW